MNKDTHIYDRLREMLGGRLSVAQFNAAKTLIDAEGSRAAFRIALGLNPDQSNDQRTSAKGRKFLIGLEVPDGKPDLVAFMPTKNDRPTIGYGTTFKPDGTPIKMGDKITVDTAEQYFAHDLQKFEDYINEVVTIDLTQNQFDALVALVYNIGMTAFRQGTIDDKLNARNFEAALATWAQYNKQAGKVLEGLKNRRAKDIALFKSA